MTRAGEEIHHSADDRRLPEVGSAAVVVPVGGLDPMLAGQLRAVLAQECSVPFDVVLSVNTSDGAVRAAVDEMAAAASARVQVIDSSSTRGAAHARNAGWRHATADAVAFCDADDRVHAGWLQALVDALADHDAVSGRVVDVFPDERSAAWHPPATPGDLPTFLGHRYVLSGNLACRRSALEKVDGFDESLTRCEDIAIGWQFTRHGLSMAYAPDAVIDYHHRAGAWPMLRQHYLYGRGMSEVLRRYGTPDGNGSGLGALRPNNQSVARRTLMGWMRRGAIGLGRLRGMIGASRTATR
jgi:cellulose synthase/poly-beta-1,6-N-acetylglucosamine synthase-like glycosyltransferase